MNRVLGSDREEATAVRLPAFSQYADINRVLFVRFGNNPVSAQVTISDAMKRCLPAVVAVTENLSADLKRVEGGATEIRIMEIQQEQYRTGTSRKLQYVVHDETCALQISAKTGGRPAIPIVRTWMIIE